MKKVLSIFTISSIFTTCGNLQKPKTEVKSKTDQKIISFPRYTKLASSKKKTISRTHSKNELFFFTDGVEVEKDHYNNSILEVVKNFESANELLYKNSENLKISDISEALNNSSILLFTGSKNKELLQKYFKKGQILNDDVLVLLDESIKSDNVLSIIFNVEEASFYAGYLSAKYLSDTYFEFDTPTSPGLKLTTIGGELDRHSTAYMGGFQQGVEYWNSKASGQNKKVEFVKLGDSIQTHYTGSYTIGQGKEMATTLVNKNIDVVMAANRGQIIDILDYVKSKNYNMLFVGTENDLATKYEEHYNRFITSVTKDFKGVLKEAVATIFGDISYDGMSIGSNFIGNVENGFISLGENSGNKVSIKEYRLLKDDEIFAKYALDNAKPTFKI